METVALASAKRRGVEPDMEALAKQRAAIVEIFNSQEDAFASGRMLDNGIVTRATRVALLGAIWGINTAHCNPMRGATCNPIC